MKNRTLSHLLTTRRTVRRALPDASMDALEKATNMAEQGSSGQIRLIVEANWPLLHVKHATPRSRALEWFSQLHLWDTEHNNGVLIYLLFAERRVEIVADRGLNHRVMQAQWEGICRSMEASFTGGQYELGLSEGINAIGALLREHFPALTVDNELPDRPMIV